MKPWTRCITSQPARISAVNVPLGGHAAAAVEHARDAETPAAKAAALRAVGLRGAVLAELGTALDEPVAEALLYARAYADSEVRGVNRCLICATPHQVVSRCTG